MPPTCLVSVVIPCYNAVGYLPASVESVIAQGAAETEILIVDDCSTDDSAAVAKSLAERHARVQAFRQPINRGPAAARNRGLQIARGEFVCFLDADDTYAPNFFREALAEFEAQPSLAAVTTGIELIDCEREVHFSQLRLVEGSLPSNFLVRRSVAELMGGFPEDPVFRGEAAGEDATFRQTLLRHFNTCHRNEPLMRYLVKPGGHFHHFLDRTQVRIGQTYFIRNTKEELDGTLNTAVLAYYDRCESRIAGLHCVRSRET